VSVFPELRAAVTDDAAALAAFGARCFCESYAAHNAPSDMALHLARTYGPELQAREIADPARECLVAVEAGAVVGYALLGAGVAHASVTGPSPWQVHRFYVDQRWHGRGLAPSLMTAAVEAARRRGAGTLWLAAWDQNPRALGFYAKMGFADVGVTAFTLGTLRQTDRVMARSLGAS
jgi:GNAT superfamily N-acetyltransferase